MDFLREFQQRIKEIDAQQEVPKPKIKYTAQSPEGHLYNVHERTLVEGKDPRDCTNRPVAWGMSKEEADRMKHMLGVKVIGTEPNMVKYYEAVRQDGYKSGVLDNDYTKETLMKGESYESEEKQEPQWKD